MTTEARLARSHNHGKLGHDLRYKQSFNVLAAIGHARKLI